MRPIPTARRPLLAAAARLARGRVAAHAALTAMGGDAAATSRRRPPRPGLTTRHSSLAALATVARAVAVYRTPTRPRGVLPSWRQRGSLAASPLLRPSPTAASGVRRHAAASLSARPSRQWRGNDAAASLSPSTTPLTDHTVSSPRGAGTARSWRRRPSSQA